MSFSPPELSRSLLGSIDFSTASATEDMRKLKQMFDDFDETEDGQSDPSQCKALLKFPNGVVFWSAKMAICADGPAASSQHRTAHQLDASGLPETAWGYPGTDLTLSAEAVSYVVMPLHGFTTKVGLSKGDLAVVIWKDKLATAVAGEVGPGEPKIGEGSILLHSLLGHEPCSSRDSAGRCQSIMHVGSIPEDVLVFVFPNTRFTSGVNQSNINQKVKEKVMPLWEAFAGAASDGQPAGGGGFFAHLIGGLAKKAGKAMPAASARKAGATKVATSKKPVVAKKPAASKKSKSKVKRAGAKTKPQPKTAKPVAPKKRASKKASRKTRK